MAKKKKSWTRKEAATEAKKVRAKLEGYAKAQLCGSYRRGCKTVKDLDLVVVPTDIDVLHKSIARMAKSVEVSGPRTVRIILPSGMQVDFMIVKDHQYESAMLHFTGSKWFNIKCRKIAKVMGFKLNEYGLHKNSKVVAKTELGILESIRMAKFVEPTLRNM